MNSLEELVVSAQADFGAAPDAAALENAKAKYLGKTGQVRPDEAAIAAKLGLNVKTVHAALDELVGREHLKVVHAERPDEELHQALHGGVAEHALRAFRLEQIFHHVVFQDLNIAGHRL